MDLPLSPELLAYYRKKLEEYETERQAFIDKLAEIELRHSEAHQLRWEVRKRTDEISDLQRALNDSQHFLYDERETLLRALAENDDLRRQEFEDRGRIKQLLELTAAAGDDVAYFDDGGNLKQIFKQPQKAVLGPSIRSSVRPGPAPAFKVGVQKPTHPAPTTITVQNDKVDSLMMTIDSLRTQLEEQQKLYKDRTAAFAEERQQWIDQDQTKSVAEKKFVAQLTEQLERTERLLRNNIKEHLILRNNAQVTERKLVERTEGLQEQVEKLTVQLRQMAARKDMETQIVANVAEDETKAYVNHFRQQLMDKEEQLRAVQEEREIERAEMMKLREMDKRKVLKAKADCEFERQRFLRLIRAVPVSVPAPHVAPHSRASSDEDDTADSADSASDLAARTSRRPAAVPPHRRR
eukprot:gnl/Hemi2/22790_TR7631_c0_g1_i1.p1 gnl/Hemi2/22790_TR7631_c0_g1~~gnl/Hemi2/22790_TR7631_c0_g1_i1.p1  ORF type:complete len:409 (-),score=134.15 gnl/Hemi2/22790_TR7631_c0_g1_i1:141-1367(-)